MASCQGDYLNGIISGAGYLNGIMPEDGYLNGIISGAGYMNGIMPGGSIMYILYPDILRLAVFFLYLKALICGIFGVVRFLWYLLDLRKCNGGVTYKPDLIDHTRSVVHVGKMNGNMKCFGANLVSESLISIKFLVVQ